LSSSPQRVASVSNLCNRRSQGAENMGNGECSGLPHPEKVLDYFCCAGKSLNFVFKSWKVVENI